MSIVFAFTAIANIMCVCMYVFMCVCMYVCMYVINYLYTKSNPSATNLLHMYMYTFNNIHFEKNKKGLTGIMASINDIAVLPGGCVFLYCF